MKIELKEKVEKEIRKIREAMKEIKSSESEEAKDLFDLAKRYFEDAEYFFKNEQYIEAFEAITISWTYLDSGLRLKIFSVPQHLKDYFTIE
ncbi:MAG: DUF357 domain-containing protein [Candidatus Parvarchaeota archaeon]|nr:DUF357 domain-containing protein [Candidatus Jingweiarchaeum tengchongense]MCW1297889.1 DUF357 domain-containing protein [Candidatus Jingweiarchaeum tengchongense]MCW1299900.1 DUF357 domain-containing protein [Candidatus Jingweiarchaeum tengchongense]MCW1305096.1 DUF357 domain-containing protein [Candidatus Jingweiarchaeum tengchongense]MCW1305158.1 DUF357 domain-containing protein [Candidatus Jingweiarchaeum tengchongense]